jgi:hypothetical protein
LVQLLIVQVDLDCAKDAVECFEIGGDGFEMFRRLFHPVDCAVDAQAELDSVDNDGANGTHDRDRLRDLEPC